MSQPNPFVRGFSFTNFATDFPTVPPPGVHIDAELDGAKATLDDILRNLPLIQRDDGHLRNGVVSIDALSDALLAFIGSRGFAVRGPWTTLLSYAPGDVVAESGVLYLGMVQHAAGTFATDHAAGKWVLIFDPAEMAAASAAADATAATAARTVVEGLQPGLQAAADSASADASEAETSATSAAAAAAAAAASQAAAAISAAAALLVTKLYATTGAGIAATSSGDYFGVPASGNTYANLYKNNAGVALFIVAFPSKAAIDAITTAQPYTGGTFDAVLAKTKSTDGAFAWLGRSDLATQPLLVTDLSNSAQYQLLGSNYAPIASRFTSTVVGGELQVTNAFATSWALMVGVPTRVEIGNVYVAEARFTTSNAPTLQAMMLGFSATAPVPGDPAAILNADFMGITYRGNGGFAIYDRDTIGVPAGSAYDPVPGGGDTWTSETISMVYEHTSATAGTVSMYIDGVLNFTRNVSGLTANAYIFGGVRFGANLDVARISKLRAYGKSLDLTKRIHLDPNIGATGGTGTEGNPFLTWEEAIASYDVDTSRRELEIVLKGGDMRGSGTFDMSRWRRVTIRNSMGSRTRILGSEQLPGSGWTRIGATEYWHRPSRYLNNNVAFGGLIETTTNITQAFGRTGLHVVAGGALYDCLANNIAYTDPLFLRGSTSVHTTGAYTGKIIVRCIDGGDPNAKIFERSLYDNCLSFLASDELDGWNGGLVDLAGIDALYAFGNGFRFDRTRAHLENLYAGLILVASGFEFNHTDASVGWCTAEGTGNDNFHSGNDGEPTDRFTKIGFWNCDALGALNSPTRFGDSFSNHQNHYYGLHSCRSIGSGKDGLSAAASCQVTDFEVRDAVNAGISLAPPAGGLVADCTITVSGGKLIGNVRGITLNAGALTGMVAVIDADRVHLESNTLSSLEAFSSAAANITINARNCTTSGAAPSRGHVDRNPGTINVITGAAL